MNVWDACGVCEILSSASPASRAKISSYGVLRRFKKDEIIFEDKGVVDRFVFVVSGYVAIYKVNRNLDRKVIFVYGQGVLLNEVMVSDPVASVSCVALREVQTLSFSRRQFLEIMEGDFAFTRLVMESMSLKIRRLYRQLGNTANMMKLERQVASKLWKLGRDFGVRKDDFIQVDFDITITFLADMVGSKRESVSRIIKKFSEQGIVRMERNTCKIYKLDELENIVLSER